MEFAAGPGATLGAHTSDEFHAIRRSVSENASPAKEVVLRNELAAWDAHDRVDGSWSGALD